MSGKVYHFTGRVSAEGTLQLENLPPHTTVQISVKEDEEEGHVFDPVALEQFIDDFQERNPFANKSKGEILKELRKIREEVANEPYPD